MRTFWRKLKLGQKRKPPTDRDRMKAREAVWGTIRRLAWGPGRTLTLTASGQHLNPRRDIRREAMRAGLITGSGRQWVKLRKQIARDERRDRRAAA